MKKFYKKLKGKNSKGSPVLKLGRGSGFMATTISLKLNNPNIFLNLKYILKEKLDIEDEDFPKSRLIVKDLNHPLGWIKLTFSEE